MDVYKTWLEDGSRPRIDPVILSLYAREGAFDSCVFFSSGNDAWILMIKNLAYSGSLYVWVRSRSSELKLWMVGNLQ